MSHTTVLVTDYAWNSTAVEAEVLAQVGAELLIAETGSEEELLKLVGEADAILTCFARVSGEVIRAGRKLQVVGRYGIGVDNIDVATATDLGVLVTNVPAYCLDEVAEHSLALLLCLARKIYRYDRGIREGDWTLARGAPIFRLRGQTLGIVGFGKIGRALAERARAFGLHVLAYDPWTTPAVFESAQVEAAASIGDLAAKSDHLSIHVPLVEETRGLIGEEVLRAMKPTAFVVNTARGELIDQDALFRALSEGWIAGAGIDVFVPEHLPEDHPLLSLPNLVATPHVAFYSEESVVKLERLAAENVAAVLSGQRPASVVNPTILDLSRWSHLR
jgi:D-3-phosphoglycerate dehydrogenase